MVISNVVYEKIVMCCPKAPPETGCLLGGRNGLIRFYEFDSGDFCGEPGCYAPDVNSLNLQIQQWQKHDIHFYGIAHSHCTKSKCLSDEDKRYIVHIMQSLPVEIEHLYFPLIFPREEIISFKAIRIRGGAKIIFDNIIKKEVNSDE